MQKNPRNFSRKTNSTRTIYTRFMLITAVFILWIGGIGVRLVHLQINQHEWLAEQAQGQRRNQVKSKQLRGSIYDRSERALAMSVQAKSLFADPAEIEDVEMTANRVAAVLKVNPNAIFNDLNEAKEKGKRFVYLARRLDEETARKINDALKDTDLKKFDEPRFPGLHWKEEQKRTYPYKTLAAQVVGFSNAEDVGQAGIEQSQEELLNGAVVKKWQDRDRLGRVYEEYESEEIREPAKDIVLTISNSIQYHTEQALEKGVKAAHAKSGMAIVLDPKTGEILAMANYPTFDPNNYDDFPAENFKNKTVQGSYAPGSVFKLVTYGAALQEKLIKPDEWFSCGNGTIEVGKREFRDTHCGTAISFTKSMAISSNLGAIKTGLKVGEKRFDSYLRRFGFGETTGVELPAETRGLVRPIESWKGDSLASMSIGYEIGVTALQTAMAFATVANDGVNVRPHIIKEIRQADGRIVSAAEPEMTQVISADVAEKLRKMLREVVLTGTGKEAALNGYTSAGKTGTAWKYDPKIKRVSGSKYTSSFVGFAPADNPAVVIAVIMDEPQGALRNGGQVSAPVFRQIAEQVLPELNVAPDDLPVQDALTAQAADVPIEVETAPDAPVNSDSKPASVKTVESKPSQQEIKKPIESSERKSEKTPQKEKIVSSKPPKEIRAETNKTPTEKKEPAKSKPAAVKEKPKADTKNKSSGERARIVT
ncbi:MAG TPA: penicillin-binding transpeptidase domain-containing protein [Pyrinomonadaceae bacterium]|nr:penicillin-binding transpeptidase domain-containing protein [Pyrinomonadaceae bacterium]